MREILFRGFHKCDGGKEKIFLNGEWICGEWIEGDLSHNQRGQSFIGLNLTFIWDVIPETIGQYTGLSDKNGKKIFEGDVLKRTLKPTMRISSIFKIVYVQLKSCFSAIDIDGRSVTFISDYINCNYEIEVIGNIFENPELLGNPQ